jgi:hypothetical protein
LGVITEEEQDEGEEQPLGLMTDSPEENCYSNILMIQPRKKKTNRNKSNNNSKSKTHREQPTIPVDETVVPAANNVATPSGRILYRRFFNV